ncbi:hypothetical protein RHSIM_Rhsim07G0161100 [Rhododendron simsii]|uniref:Retrotransposon gag domain-containing protein n=1 Tax=Rhododendron simsii TaxID=118357 RepID=A0A834GNR6_RHOSS|nr:hypothetical protein RHSIM_Rhsim07G0161100 [Rhododendron simsii]
MPPKKPTGAPGLSGIKGLEATSDPVIEEIQPITQTTIVEQLRSVTETLTTMQQNQSLLMEALLALQKKSTTHPTPQAETEGTHLTGSQTETRDNQIGEGAQNLQSKETLTPPPEISSQKAPSVGVGSAAVVQNAANATPVTMEQLRALIQSEKKSLPFASDADLCPLYRTTVASMPYPEGYMVPKFIRFDGRKGNAKEHVIRFVDSLGIHSGDRNLRLREFSKSLKDKAYSWYANLAPDSVLSWEDKVKKFYSKFFYVEDRLTTLQLMKVTQRPSEDLNAYVRRFRELSVDVQEPISEDRLAKICVDGMQPTFKPHLVTHHFPDFSALYEAAWNLNETVEPPLPPPRYQHSSYGWHLGPRHTAYAASGPPPNRGRGYPAKRPKYNEPPPLPVTAAEAQAFLDAWVQDGKVTLPEARKEPTRRDMEHPDYCIYHRMVCHPTKDYWGLRTQLEKFMVEEAVELTATKDVLRNPLPNHKDNGKAVMMVTISHHEENEEPTACEIANTEGPECPNFEERRASSLQNSTKFKWLFDQFGFSQATRFEATKAILRKEPPAPLRGIPIPKWDENSKEGSPSTGNPNEKKRARDAILAKARAPAEDNLASLPGEAGSLAESHEVHEDEGYLVEYLSQCCSLSSLTQKQPNKPRKKNKKREPPTIQKPTLDEGQEEQPPALQEVKVAPECLQDGPRPQKQELEEVNLAPKGMPPKPNFLAKDLPAKKKKAFIALIREYIDVFTWNYDEMPGLDPGVTIHKLNVVPSACPVKQGHALRLENRHPDALATLASKVEVSGTPIKIEILKRSVPCSVAEIFPEEEIEDWRTPISNELKSTSAAVTLSNLKHFTIYQGVLYYRGSGGLLAHCIGEEEAKVKIQEVHDEVLHDARPSELEALDERRDWAQANLRIYQRRIARAYDALVRPRQFAEGDLILKAASHIMKRKSASKFAAKWEGPFMVKEANENGYYRVSEPDSNVLIPPINAKWLKAYHP